MQKKLMLDNEWPNGSSTWRVACDCSNAEHDVELYFDMDSKDDPWYLMLMLKVNPYYTLWQRIKTAFQILFTGEHVFYGEVMLREDGIDAMETALREGKKRITKNES